jgi:hypothetical protein
MDHTDGDPTFRLRLLECWLALAAQFNDDLGWGYAAEELEALILGDAAELVQTNSAVTARAILWREHLRRQREDV